MNKFKPQKDLEVPLEVPPEVEEEHQEEVVAEEAKKVVIDLLTKREVRDVRETSKVMPKEVSQEAEVDTVAEVKAVVEVSTEAEAKAEAEVNSVEEVEMVPNTDQKAQKVNSSLTVTRVVLPLLEKKKLIIEEREIMTFRANPENSITHMTGKMVLEEEEDSLKEATVKGMLVI